MEYDDIIIGAGSSGAVLAARLTEDPARHVLLLEAGPDYATVAQTPHDLLDSTWVSVVEHDWKYKAVPLAGREIDYPRGKVTGGSSAVNGAIALRGVPADYDEWAALGNDQWGWTKVLPYFRKLEDDQDERGDFHGSGGPIPVRRWKPEELVPLQRAFFDACKAAGFDEVRDHNHPESSGAGPWPMNTRDRVRVSTAIAYLLPARYRLNLTIRPHCLVNRLVFEGTRVAGVEVESDGERQRVYGRRVTLAAGAIASPAILLRSGIGPAEELRALGIEPVLDRPGVGANLIDHPSAGVSLVPAAGVCDTTQPVVQVGVRYTAPGSDEWNDMQLYMASHIDLRQFPGAQEMIGAPLVFSVFATLQRPRSRGSVTLTSADPHAQPKIDLHYGEDPEDMRRLVEGVRLAWQVANTRHLAPMWERAALLNESFMSLDEALKTYVGMTVTTLFHPVGSARMGPEGDAGAVVDQYGRVRGVDGLRVVDASVMPTIPRANTNLTCIMIAERVAGWMRED
jgi:choline dehydrogenase